jgi:hypothetical protein
MVCIKHTTNDQMFRLERKNAELTIKEYPNSYIYCSKSEWKQYKDKQPIKHQGLKIKPNYSKQYSKWVKNRDLIKRQSSELGLIGAKRRQLTYGYHKPYSPKLHLSQDEIDMPNTINKHRGELSIHKQGDLSKVDYKLRFKHISLSELMRQKSKLELKLKEREFNKAIVSLFSIECSQNSTFSNEYPRKYIPKLKSVPKVHIKSTISEKIYTIIPKYLNGKKWIESENNGVKTYILNTNLKEGKKIKVSTFKVVKLRSFKTSTKVKVWKCPIKYKNQKPIKTIEINSVDSYTIQKSLK